jgi:putative membrane protein insertion efficiency factor
MTARVMVRIYQTAISPWLVGSCRFFPTCSHYALEAFERYGFWKGGWLTVRRLLRCHPFCRGGYDPVP